MAKIWRGLIFFLLGGTAYFLLELAARKYSHWSMFCAGGLAVLLIDAMNRAWAPRRPFWLRCTFGALIITGIELVAGCLVNLWAGWNVWDYSDCFLHFKGQICLRFTIIWFFLTAPILWLSTGLRRFMT